MKAKKSPSNKVPRAKQSNRILRVVSFRTPDGLTWPTMSLAVAHRKFAMRVASVGGDEAVLDKIRALRGFLAPHRLEEVFDEPAKKAVQLHLGDLLRNAKSPNGLPAEQLGLRPEQFAEFCELLRDLAKAARRIARVFGLALRAPVPDKLSSDFLAKVYSSAAP